MPQQLDDLVRKLQTNPELKEKLNADAKALTKGQYWFPNGGLGDPQVNAYFSKADELFYGGEAGGGKSDLLLGVALNNHRRSLLLRRRARDLNGLVDRGKEIMGAKAIRGDPPIYRAKNKIILFGSCQHLEDREKHQGIPKDFIGYDEITQFMREQFVYINAWARSTFPGQRVRKIATGNPPTTPEGMWVIEYWAPWLDDRHPNPALPGELRYFTTIGDKDVELDDYPGEGPVIIDGKVLLDHRGKPVKPVSRTFIQAGLEDNPDLAETGYGDSLAALPAELSGLRTGEFKSVLEDSPFQLFPSDWVEAAFNRWNVIGRTSPMNAVGVDVAQGGLDTSVISRRHGVFYDDLLTYPGKDTPDGPTLAALVVQAMRGCEVIIDMGGGYGISTRDHLKHSGIKVTEFNGSNEGMGKDKSGQLKFRNRRAQAHWHFRELLDPVNGSNIALPPDSLLRQELLQARYRVSVQGVQVEEKAELKKRIGRSPDRMDAVILAAFAKGVTAAQRNANSSLQQTATTSGRNPRRRP